MPPPPKGTAAMGPKALKQINAQIDESAQRVREFLYSSLSEPNE
jgi:hypothetical protein